MATESNLWKALKFFTSAIINNIQLRTAFLIHLEDMELHKVKSAELRRCVLQDGLIP